MEDGTQNLTRRPFDATRIEPTHPQPTPNSHAHAIRLPAGTPLKETAGPEQNQSKGDISGRTDTYVPDFPTVSVHPACHELNPNIFLSRGPSVEAISNQPNKQVEFTRPQPGTIGRASPTPGRPERTPNQSRVNRNAPSWRTVPRTSRGDPLMPHE